jgi:thioredoxin reductase (NADPH)
MQNNIYDVLIIGIGPAGLQAAIYTSRANLKTAIFGKREKSHLWKAHLIDNYFGFNDGIEGKDLLEKGIKQVEKFKTEIFEKEITSIKINQDLSFEVKDEERNVYKTKTIIIATGMDLQSSGIKNEEKFIGKGLSYCVTCDGYFYKNKKIGVIGSENFAGETALELLIYTKDITILSNGGKFDFSETVKKHLEENNITLIETEKLEEFTGDNKLDKIKDAKGKLYEFDGIFMAVGQAGASAFAKELGMQTEGKFIKINNEGKTNIPGIYAAGDCAGSWPQVSKSVGSGSDAAASIIKQINNP